MPATAVLKERYQMGNGKVNIVDITPGVYATDGVAVSKTQMGITRVDAVMPAVVSGYTFEYVHATGKLKSYIVGAAGALTEVANATNLNFPVRCVVIGK